ncbi:MAG: efflux RND transporter periplasmic adaptor subunit [Mariniblastus sp.]
MTLPSMRTIYDNQFSASPFLVFASFLTLAIITATAQAQPGRGPASVAVGKVAKIQRAGAESFVGTLQPLRKSTVGTAVDGRVLSISVEPGDPVRATNESTSERFIGQPLLQLRTGTLEIEIGAAEIQLKLSQQAMDELGVSLPREIELASARAAEANARLSYSKNNYNRARKLRGASGAISQGELEQAKSQYLADQEAARATTIDFDKLKSTRELRVLQTQLVVEASKQELARLNDLKSKYTIRAPFEGLVTQKLTDVGEWVTKGQAIVEVVQLNPIEMIINAPQEQLNALQNSLGSATDEKPLTAEIKIDGYDKPLQGIVKRIVPQGDLRSRTFPVRIEIENPMVGSSYLLQPGMLGRASLEIGKVRDRVLVKKDAIVLGGGSPVVFKTIPPTSADADMTVTGIPVTIGDSFGSWIQVTGDLSPGDQVVVLGNERLRPNQAVKISRVDEDVPE